MFFGFGLEEFQNLIWDFIIGGQRVEIRASGVLLVGLRRMLLDGLLVNSLLPIIQRRGFGGECETIALLEPCDVFKAFFTSVADLEQVGFEDRNSVGKKFRERPVQIVPQRGIHRILENVCQLARNLGEAWKAVTRRSAAQRVRRDIQTLEILAPWLDVLQHADVFPQILQVLRGFLEEDFDSFAVGNAHARPSVTSSGFCNSSAVGLRYRMQSFSTMA